MIFKQEYATKPFTHNNSLINLFLPQKQRQVRNVVKRYGDIIGKDVHPHTFRYSYAIHCVRNGWDIRRLQQVLGHSSLNVKAVTYSLTTRTSKNCTIRRRFRPRNIASLLQVIFKR